MAKIETTEQRHAKSKQMGIDREQYLAASNAVVTPPEMLALWVAVWLKQGGKVKAANADHKLPEYDAQGNVVGHHYRNWTPRVGAFIPKGYGSTALDLVILDHYTAMQSYKGRNRPDTIHGHTKIKVLRGTYETGYMAETYETFGVVSVAPNIYALATQHNAIEVLSKTLAN